MFCFAFRVLLDCVCLGYLIHLCLFCFGGGVGSSHYCLIDFVVCCFVRRCVLGCIMLLFVFILLACVFLWFVQCVCFVCVLFVVVVLCLLLIYGCYWFGCLRCTHVLCCFLGVFLRECGLFVFLRFV